MIGPHRPASAPARAPWWLAHSCRGCAAPLDLLAEDRPLYLGRGAFLCAACCRDAEAIAGAGFPQATPEDHLHYRKSAPPAGFAPDGTAAADPAAAVPSVHGHNADDRPLAERYALAWALLAMASLMDGADDLDRHGADGSLFHPARRAVYEAIAALGGSLADVYAAVNLPASRRTPAAVLGLRRRKGGR